jgi:hypothetical protein
MSDGGTSCCFRACREAGLASLRMDIWPPSDLPVVHTRAHTACLERFREASVGPDPVEMRGQIPAGARCLFCGRKLPIIGIHPFALEIWETGEPGGYWAHTDCLRQHIQLDLNT